MQAKVGGTLTIINQQTRIAREPADFSNQVTFPFFFLFPAKLSRFAQEDTTVVHQPAAILPHPPDKSHTEFGWSLWIHDLAQVFLFFLATSLTNSGQLFGQPRYISMILQSPTFVHSSQYTVGGAGISNLACNHSISIGCGSRREKVSWFYNPQFPVQD